MFMFFRRRSRASDVVREAERMIREFGQGALSAAADLSWREDAGLIESPDSGHWHKVQLEIGRRLGAVATPALKLSEAAARLQ